MERVDVEITPWMDDELKRELALRAEDERKHSALLQEEVLGQQNHRPKMDEERMREIYGDDIPAFENEQMGQNFSRQPSGGMHEQQKKKPLQDLLKNYLLAAAQDRKNIAIFFLSMVVLCLSIALMRSPTALLTSHQPFVSSRSLSIPTSTSISDTSSGVLPVPEPSATKHAGAPTILAIPEKDAAETPLLAVAQAPSEDSMDSIEARFEFAGE
ncbi:MAG: hypothetical protein L6R41_007163 [Letrouitia leprolyta]|nr:MAG: hypothetical protein L6R41_007163 [Letrouitia leprolyta]